MKSVATLVVLAMVLVRTQADIQHVSLLPFPPSIIVCDRSYAFTFADTDFARGGYRDACDVLARFSRTIKSVAEATGTLTLDSGCKTTDTYGSNDCAVNEASAPMARLLGKLTNVTLGSTAATTSGCLTPVQTSL